MYILGISAYYHDSAAVLLKDDEIIAAAQEERFTRKKADEAFPTNAVQFCLSYGGVSIDELDAVIFYDKPLLKLERLLETYYAFAPKGFFSFLSAMPVWIKEKMLLKKVLTDELLKIEKFDKKKLRLLFSEHHLSHAASSFYPSPFQEAAILTIDGVGEWTTASICKGEQNQITVMHELKFPHSVGLLYSAFTYFLGFKVNSGEYKLMGLAPYGDPNSSRIEEYKRKICENIVDISDDGSIWLNQEYFDYATGLKMVNEKQWEQLFGFSARKPEDEITQEHSDLALTIQQITEDIVIRMAHHAKKITGAKNLCLAGGVALNCVANGKLLKAGVFDNIWVQPAAGDAGGALGAAYAAYYIFFNKERQNLEQLDKMKGSYLGPEFSDIDVENMSRKYKASSTHYEDINDLAGKVAQLISEGNVIGWFQGRMEYGPRSLGNRSILGDARSPDMQKKLNLKIKYREGFRPFAPSVLYEDVYKYFELDKPSPYMLVVANVVKERQAPVPDGYYSMPLKDKLYYLRSDVPSITHLDYSARIQTVHKETNPRFKLLLEKLKTLTGYSLVVNTSFNVRGEPIVCSPQDAYKCFMRTEMDYLVVNNYLFDKREQLFWSEKTNWKEEYKLD